MKKILIIVLMFFCIQSNAQEYAIDKGSKIISLSGSLVRSNSTEIIAGSSLNYFFVKNLFIGGGAEFSHVDLGSFSSSAIGVGPNLGVALGNSDSKLYPVLSAGYRCQIARSTVKSHNLFGPRTSSSSNNTGSDVFFSADIIMPINDNLGFVFGGSYHKLSVNNRSISILVLGLGIVGLLF